MTIIELIKILFNILLMGLVKNVIDIWSPVRKYTSKISFRKTTKTITKSIWVSLWFLITFLYYGMAKPEKLTLQMSKTAEKVAEMKIPKMLRTKFFNSYSKYYKVKLHQIIDPIDSFETFSQFFTRRVQPRYIDTTPHKLLSPADSKILKISQIHNDQCSIIKGASYSLGELITGKNIKFTDEEINSLKKQKSNKLFQIIFYLAPGDYHRFHSPTDIYVTGRQKIEGILLSVNQKTLIKRKKVYEKNGRLVVSGTWNPLKDYQENSLYMNLTMVGALNVGRIAVKENQSFKRGQELGYFNLGSTIVMIFQAKEIKEWFIREGQSIRYGDPFCEVMP